MRTRQAKRALVAAAAAATMLVTTSTAFAATSNDNTQFSVTAGSLAFSTAPDVPNLPALTLNGQAQTLNGTMNNFGVDDATGSGSGWNLTVSGDNSGGKSAVFKQYCPNATCGSDTGPGYVSGGHTLAQNSITLNSTGASFTGLNGTTGTAPTHQCNAGTCSVDAAPASPTKIVSAASGAGMGTWGSTGWSGTSIAASAPSTVQALQTNEVYRVDLLWTLGSGP
jgi:hypothetical protein